MVIYMTREEYRKKYGSNPVVHSDSDSALDISVSPRRMTRAEYDAEFNTTVEKKPFISSTDPTYKASVGGGFSDVPTNVAKSFGNLPSSARNLVRASIAPINPYDMESPVNIFANSAKGKEELEAIFKQRGFKGGLKDIADGFKEVAGKGYDIYKGIGEKIYENLEENTLKQSTGKGAGYDIRAGVGASIANATEVVAKKTIEDPLLIPSVLYAPSKIRGTGMKSDTISDLAKPLTKGKDTSVKGAYDTYKTSRNAKVADSLEREIYNIENGYAKTRNANQYSADEGSASRKRIANTDVLVGSVDGDGVIRTKQKGGAVEKYSKQTIDGDEGVVRENLKREGAMVNLGEIERDLTVSVYRSGLEGADLLKAVKGIKNEIAGLRLRADEFDNIPLDKVHDAKISTTRNINYKTDSTPTITYRKAVGSTYKRVVENKSKVEFKIDGKKYTVKDVNAELAKYYEDIERLQNLDGMRVKGGKLGKYAAQISGNMIGGVAGGVIGGLPGAAVGTIVGGEAASFIKGKQMAGKFGSERGMTAPENQILAKARELGKSPAVTDLTVPSPKVGAKSSIPKTKEIYAVEKDIARNVQAQKAAIKAKDFTLVAALKEIYDRLVETLRELIKKHKETANKQGGFIKNPVQTSKSGKPTETQSEKLSPTYKDTVAHTTQKAIGVVDKLLGKNIKNRQGGFVSTGGDDIPKEIEPLVKEAKKYKSAEEFVKRIQGSATQYGDYVPNLRGYGMGDYKNITELGIKPDEMITIYRGIDDITGKIPKKINDGDFVTTDFDSAWSYAGDNKVVSMEVPAKTLYTDAVDDFTTEPFYTGSEYVYTKQKVSPMSESQLTDIWNKANKKPNTQGGFISTGYKETGNLTTKILKDLEGRETVSRQYILDATNRGDLKQAERDITRQILETIKGDTVNVKEFADKVKAELLPLKRSITTGDPRMVTKGEDVLGTPHYENVALPDELRGKVKDYQENIYQSPIKTSAGSTHFNNLENKPDGYFGHTRIEDMADNKTRRVIEVQSDLYQKGNLEREVKRNQEFIDFAKSDYGKSKATGDRAESLKKATDLVEGSKKLAQYNDPTAHFRMIREEIQKAAKDGKTKLQFPTGETAMKIEGLGHNVRWTGNTGRSVFSDLTPDNMKVGMEAFDGNSDWIITDVLGDGKFKAVPKNTLDNYPEIDSAEAAIKGLKENPKEWQEFFDADGLSESFDISGKVDTNNPIYKFYEKDVQKYLNKFGGKRVVDERGVSWIEVPITKEHKGPVEAFGKTKPNILLKGAGVGLGAAATMEVIKQNKNETRR